jgi:non-heme chloroperoxidase
MNRRNVFKSTVLAFAGASTAATSEKKPGNVPFVTTVDGVSLFYRDWGTGPPVVFLAPWGLHSDWWEYQMAHLADQGLRCGACDRRGHGHSSEPVRGYDFDTLAGDLNTVMERLDLRGVTLVGHSMGAGEVVRYLARHGAGRVARIVLVAPITPFVLKTADNPDGADPASLEAVRKVLSQDRPTGIAGAASGFFGEPKNPVSTEMKQWWINMLMDCSLKVLIELHHAFTETDFRPDLRAIAVPTLIVHGDCDTSTRLELTGQKTANFIRGSQLKVYEGAAHALPITHLDKLNADLLAFIKS